MGAPCFDILLAGIEAVSFDFDGTLASTQWRKLRMWPAILRHPKILATFGVAVEDMRGLRFVDARAEIARSVAARIARKA